MTKLKHYKMVDAKYCTDCVCVIPSEVYLKHDVDDVIAELEAENKRLKASPEQIMKELFDKVLIYPHEKVRLEDAYKLAVSLKNTKRALYKACANWAHHRVFVRYKINEKAWENVERKCRAKAEEYK